LGYDPDADIAHGTKTLVLSGNDRTSGTTIGSIPRIVATLSDRFILLFVLPGNGQLTGLSAHDAAAHPVGDVWRLFLRHISGEVDQVVEFRDLGVFEFLDVALEF